MDWVTYNEDGWRPLRTWDIDVNNGKLGPKAIPGDYQAVLNIDGEKYSQTFQVLKDPNTAGSLKDIKAQFKYLMTLRSVINNNVDLINKIEEIRYSLQNDYENVFEKKARADQLDQQLYEVESHLFDVKLTGAREDAFRNPNKIYGRLCALASDLTRYGADFKPTNQQIEVAELLIDRLQKQEIEFEVLLEDDFFDSEKK